MSAAEMKEILRKEYGITSEEEFNRAVEMATGIDIGIFAMPLGRSEYSERKDAVA